MSRGTRATRMHSRAATRRAKALELRAGGASFRAIANELGVGLATAFEDVRQALAEWGEPAAAELKQLEGKRLDIALKAIWGKVVNGDLKAVDVFVRLSARRSALLGLDATVRIEMVGGVVDSFIAQMGWSAAEVVELLRAAAATPVVEGALQLDGGHEDGYEVAPVERDLGAETRR